MDRNELTNDAETAHRYAMDALQSQMWTAMPAIVNKVDLTAMTIDAQPAIQGVCSNADGSETKVNLPVLLDVPLCFPNGGGFVLTFPVVAGDEVLVIIASRCIDAWWQNGGIQPPIEDRMHDLSDGFAIPGPRSQVRLISGISSTKTQLRSADGNTYVEVGSGTIKLKGTVTNDGNLTVNGDLHVTGAINCDGAISAVGDIKTGVGPLAISLLTHTHQVISIGNPSGPPLP